MQSMREQGSKYWLWMVGFLALAAITLLGGCASKTEAAPPPPPEVQVVNIQQKDVPVYGEWVATLDGYVNADIRPQVSGYLLKQNYREGSLVHKGDVLFEIDPASFRGCIAAGKRTAGAG